MRKKFTKLCFAVACLSLGGKISSQTQIQWAKGWGGTSDDAVVSIATDAAGNVYSLGTFLGTADLDPGPGTYTVASLGGNDISITKLDPSGNFLWAKRLGGPGNDGAGRLTVDAAGNVYSTGFYIYTADFDPGPGVSNMTGTNNEIFISKLDANGNFVWAKSMGGTGTDQGMGIHVDNLQNVYTSGFFNTTADFDPGAATYTITSPGGNCIFVSKLDVNGNFVWAKSMGGAGGSFQNYCSAITTDASGNVYTTGSFVKTVDFDPGAGTYTLACNGGFDQDVFISKLDPSGNFSWAVSIGGTTYDNGFSIGCDAAGDVYTAGTFAFVTDFDASASTYTLDGGSGHDAFITKYSSAGNFMWAKSLGGTGYESATSLCINGSNIYTAGTFDSSTDFDPNGGVVTLTPVGGGLSSIFISVLDLAGNYTNAISMNSQHSYDALPSIALDGMYIFAGGAFQGTSDFDPSSGTYTLTAVSASNSDAFVEKIGGVVAGLNSASFNTGEIKVFPNPAHNYLSIFMPGMDTQKKATICLMNSVGQEVKRANVNSSETISLENLTAGIYFYTIQNNDQLIHSGKVVIQ